MQLLWVSRLLALAFAYDHAVAQDIDYTIYVNPLMGGSGPYPGLAFGGGDIFVGAALPFGVVKLGIDTYEPSVSLNTLNGGWTPQGLVTGISMLHESGTGGFPKYGVISHMPLTAVSAAAGVNLLDNRTYWQSRGGGETATEVAQVGYYSTVLENKVSVELGASRHAGIMQYSFPTSAFPPAPESSSSSSSSAPTAGPDAANTTAEGGHILVDLSHYLPDENGGFVVQAYLGGELHLGGDNGSVYHGFATYGGGWNDGAPYTVYFCGEFDSPPDRARTFRGANTQPLRRYHGFGRGEIPTPTFENLNTVRSGPMSERVGAVFSWTSGRVTIVRSKVGVSFISAGRACQFKDKEITSWDVMDATVAARKAWNEEVFSKVRVDLPSAPFENSLQVNVSDSTETNNSSSNSTADKRVDENSSATYNETNLYLLYSSLYFMHLMPSNRTGENPLWDSQEPYWDDFYTLWDIFRCTISLYHLIQPVAYSGMIRALIDIWRHEGFMPDGRSGNYNGLVQGGSNADNVLADAWVKGLGRADVYPQAPGLEVGACGAGGGINWSDGYAAMRTDAEVVPYNTFYQGDPSSSNKEGRGALADWLTLGYVAAESTRCISRTVEYSLNDYALSVVAAREGAPGDAQKYLRRSAGWQRVWRANTTHRGFSGFPTPRFRNGSWDDDGGRYNPALCGGCEWRSISYEAAPFEYAFTVPMDMQGLVGKMGGKKEFERRLDYMFQPNSSEQDLSVNGAGITTLMNIGNEPDFATPYLYNYLNKQYKSVARSRQLANQYFHNAPYGVPGNSDAGALNSWLVWQLLGLYPVVTQPIYLLQSPWFPDINVTVNGNRTLRITSTPANATASSGGGQGRPQLGQKGYYVQAVRVNGEAWSKNWIDHASVMVEGGTIEFLVGDTPSAWETGEVPPSPGHVELDKI